MRAVDPLGQPSAPFFGVFSRGLVPPLARELRGWALLAAGSLAVAGLLALLLAASRTPVLGGLLPWGPAFFRTALVTHVVFSFIVWYLAFLGALSVVATARGGGSRAAGLGMAGLVLAVLGSGLLLVPTLAEWGEPSLNNYVPVLVHPLYYLGLGLLGLGVTLAVLRLFANAGGWRDPVVAGTLAAGACLLVAMACFVLAWLAIPSGQDVSSVNERLFWGGGHVLQFTNTALMLTGWHLLAGLAAGEAPLPPRLFGAAMAALVLFVLPAPAFYALFPVMGWEHREAFTLLLRYGLVLSPVVMGLGLVALFWRRRAVLRWTSVPMLALGLSILVFGIGGVFGYFLGVSDTRTPSHYHAVIGGVNLTFMGLMLAFLLPLLSRMPDESRAVRLQFPLYGLGQLMFSVGMFAAGAAGVPRKTAGAEQGLDSLGKIASMAVTGLGGLVAVIGGAMFVWISLRWLLARPRHG
ncbi:cbb3-type cytochrome c oxidase subunit I [Telmatospirillum sp. J64-1]|uniref:cbb3-type cytochrome c oxidase subunit I n=1 Tax=Telmatospirillum sp. J64-1 TaxID=2502183 RepID=UPI00115D0E9E|nr:cbb3-type cytochrome c oxidase subunit I [Telmatospirillum sp. J64-1]